jgi:hypothetical protein
MEHKNQKGEEEGDKIQPREVNRELENQYFSSMFESPYRIIEKRESQTEEDFESPPESDKKDQNGTPSQGQHKKVEDEEEEEEVFDRAAVWEAEGALSLEERRQRYSTKNYVTLNEVVSWSQQAKPLNRGKANQGNTASWLSQTHYFAETKFQPNDDINKKIALWHGDSKPAWMTTL